jgi:DNA-binding response OmpR family regulator
MLFDSRARTINRLLIVEDEPLVAFDTEHGLSEAGYEIVATVDRVEDALRVIEQEELDLVLADVALSEDGNGIEVAKEASRKGVAVLFVTALCPIEAQQFAVGCLAKPYRPRDLLVALEAIEAQRQGKRMRRLPEGLSLYGSRDESQN